MIIHSILDTDLYKFTTSYAYVKLFPYASGTFVFKDRDETRYTDEFLEALREEVRSMAEVRLAKAELEYMASHCRFIPRVYWEWLQSFRFEPERIQIYLDEHHELHVEVEDFLYKATLYEVPLLAVITELGNRLLGHVAERDEVVARLFEKVELSNQHQLPFSEFGTRRRFSFAVQDGVINYLNENARYCLGTSNCHFGMKYNMKMMGTHPHEWFMFHGAQFGYKHANYMALENWVNVYDGDLGTALSDTYTSESFLSNFSRKQAKLFDGVRCDSGDEFEFVDHLTSGFGIIGLHMANGEVVDGLLTKSDKPYNLLPILQCKVVMKEIRTVKLFNCPMYVTVFENDIVPEVRKSIDVNQTENFVWEVPLQSEQMERSWILNGTCIYWQVPSQCV